MSKIKVVIDLDLKELIPGYLVNRQNDIKSCLEFLNTEKFNDIANVGHRLKGNARTYGFLYLEELGTQLEELAVKKNSDDIKLLLDQYEKYLNNLDITYEET